MDKKKCTSCQKSFLNNILFCPYDGTKLTLNLGIGPDIGNEGELLQPLTGFKISPGQVFLHKYQLVEQISEGGTGVVYRAVELTNQKEWAIKILKPGLADQIATRQRFQREATLLKRVNHPNLVSLHEWGISDEGYSYIITEYLHGKTLRQILREEKTLEVQKIVEICTSIGSGLVLAHQKGILHRDLKPENIILVHQGDNNQVVKIIDFGIAKEINSDISPLTSPQIILGTPQYLSPEQSAGDLLTFQSDIYALGIMAYEMLVGKTPFVSEISTENTPRKIITRHLTILPQPPSLRRTDIPVQLEQVVLKALAKDPKDRFPTMLDFVQELRASIGLPFLFVVESISTPRLNKFLPDMSDILYIPGKVLNNRAPGISELPILSQTLPVPPETSLTSADDLVARRIRVSQSRLAFDQANLKSPVWKYLILKTNLSKVLNKANYLLIIVIIGIIFFLLIIFSFFNCL